MTESVFLSMEQSRRTAAAVCACINDQDYATGLIALAILAELAGPCDGDRQSAIHPLLQSVRVTAEGLYRHRAIQEEFSITGNKTEHLKPFMDSLRVVPFEATASAASPCKPELPVPRPRRGDVLFDIIRVKEWSRPGNWDSLGISWLVRGGQWAYWSMNETGRVLLCRIAAASLSHSDPVTVVLTMKLGRALGFGAAYQSNGGAVSLTVAEALESVGELPAPSRRDSRWSSSIYSGFTGALTSLCDAGVAEDLSWPAGRGLSLEGPGEPVPSDWTELSFRFAPARIPVPAAGWREIPRLEVVES